MQASYRRFRRQYGKYPGVAPVGLIVADILDCNWTCEGCVSGETLVHTVEGLVPARTLTGRTVDTLSDDGVYRQAEWKDFGVQRLWRVEFLNGDEVYATAEHEWVTRDSAWVRRASRNGVVDRTLPPDRVRTPDLVGRSVPMVARATFAYDETAWHEGVGHGLVFGDGSVRSNGTSFVHQYGDNQHLVERFFDRHSHQTHAARRAPWGTEYGPLLAAYAGALPGAYKTTMPSVNEHGESYVRGFIAGLIAADGHVNKQGSVYVHQADFDVLTRVRHLAAEVGLPSRSILVERTHNPWTNEYAPCWRLTFTKDGMYDRRMIVKDAHWRNMEASGPPRRASSMRVVAVEPTDRVEMVYCCVEPETHSWVLGQGYLTGNCWSKFGWRNAPEKPLVLQPGEVAKRLAADGMAARISGGEPTLHWDHLFRVVQEFLWRTSDQVFIVETNGSLLSKSRLLALDDLEGAERIVLSIGVKATTPELLADLTGMTAKTAARMHADQYAALRFVATECDHLNFGATFLDRYTDPAGFADLILEAEGWRGGPGRLGISVFRQYGDANAFYVPKRMREPDAGRQSEEADEAGRG